MTKRILFIITALLFVSAGAFAQGAFAVHQKTAQDANGHAIANALVKVCALSDSACSTPSTIYSDSIGTAKANPFTADTTGNYEFWATPGDYTVQIAKAGYAPYSYHASFGPSVNGSNAWAGNQTPDADNTRSIGSALKRFIGYFTNLYAKWINGIYFVNQYSGADFGAKLTACVADLPSNGGTCRADDIIGSQSMASDVTISKSNVKIVLGQMQLSNASVGRILIAAGTNGVTIEGCGNGDQNAANACTLLQTTSASAMIQIGDSATSSNTTAVTISNLAVKITNTAGVGIQGYRALQPALTRVTVVGTNFAGGPYTTQQGIVLDGGTAFAKGAILTATNATAVHSPLVISGAVGTTGFDANNQNTIIGGTFQAGGTGDTGSVCIDIQTGDSNVLLDADVENCDTGLRFDKTRATSVPFVRFEEGAVNTDVLFTANSANIKVFSDASDATKTSDLGANNSHMINTIFRFGAGGYVAFKGLKDATQDLDMICGLTVDVICEMNLRGFSGTTYWQLRKLANNTFTIHDTANNVDSFTAGTHTILAAKSGFNVQISNKLQALTTFQLGANGTTVNAIITSTATLTYTAIAAQTCQEQPVTVTNSSTTNFGVSASPRATLGNANLSWSSWVSVAGTVQVRVCNPTTGSITPSAVAWGVTVTQ